MAHISLQMPSPLLSPTSFFWEYSKLWSEERVWKLFFFFIHSILLCPFFRVELLDRFWPLLKGPSVSLRSVRGRNKRETEFSFSFLGISKDSLSPCFINYCWVLAIFILGVSVSRVLGLISPVLYFWPVPLALLLINMVRWSFRWCQANSQYPNKGLSTWNQDVWVFVIAGDESALFIFKLGFPGRWALRKTRKIGGAHFSGFWQKINMEVICKQ